jgi:hypothetical protein
MWASRRLRPCGGALCNCQLFKRAPPPTPRRRESRACRLISSRSVERTREALYWCVTNENTTELRKTTRGAMGASRMLRTKATPNRTFSQTAGRRTMWAPNEIWTPTQVSVLTFTRTFSYFATQPGQRPPSLCTACGNDNDANRRHPTQHQSPAGTLPLSADRCGRTGTLTNSNGKWPGGQY